MIRKIVIALVALVALVVVGALAASILIDPNKFKDQIAAAAEDATGRKLTLAGKVGLKLFTLTPSITVADVALANADWGSRPEMVKFKSLVAEVQLLPLLSSQVKINRVQLEGADILLETNKDGIGNWVFAPAKKEAVPAEQPKDAKAAKAPPAVEVRHVAIKDLNFTYRDGKTGQTTNLELSRLTLKAESNAAPLLIVLDGTLNGKAMAITGKLATIDALKAAGEKPLPLALDIKFGNSHVIGDLTVSAKGAPRIAGKLDIRVLDVKELQEASGQKGGDAKAGGQAQPAAADGKQRMFSDAPLNLSALKAAEADLDLSGARIVLEGGDLQNLAAKIALKGGKLSVKPFTVELKGATLSGAVMVDGSGTPALAIAVSGRKIDVGALMQQPGKEKLIEGMADLDIDLVGSGASMHAIAASLNGKTLVQMGESQLNNKYLRLVAGDLFKLIDPWAAKEDTGKIHCVLSKFDIKGGLATNQAMIVDGAAFSVLGDGKINLGPETLDLVVDAKPKNSSLLNLAVPIRIGGTLLNPSFTPDPAALAKGLIGAAGNVLAKGAGGGGGIGGLLGGVLGGQQAAQPAQAQSASGGGNSCLGKAAPAAQPAPQGQAPAASPSPAAQPAAKPSPAGAVDSLSKGVKGLLKP